MDAARGIIAEDGLEALTVSRVVERAESSVGSFYARFDGKDDLLRYLEERMGTEARKRWDEAVASRAWEDLPLDAVVRSVVEMLVQLHSEDGRDREALARRGDAEARRRRIESFHVHVERDVRELLLRRRSEIDHPDPIRAARAAYRWAVGGIRELTSMAPRDGSREARWDDADVVEEVTRGVTAYLGGASGPGGEETVEYFDVWQ